MKIRKNDFPLRDHLLPRPRVDEIFHRAAKTCKLIYVIAGAGYGKTAAVQNYISKQENAIVRWLQLTESDNIGSHYWESISHLTSFDNPELARNLRELGFPDTLSKFKQFAGIVKHEEHRTRKTYLVLDDFHVINSKQALKFAERCANLFIHGACVIIISRTQPDINTVNMLSKGKLAIIAQEDLYFTQNEIQDYLAMQLLPCTAENAQMYHKKTKGWAFAINLLGIVLRKSDANFELAMKLVSKNINNLFETEAWEEFSQGVKKALVRLSLVSDLPLPLHNEVLYAPEEKQFISEFASFVSYDRICNIYRIHPLYINFLLSKQCILSSDEKKSTYRSVALWCLNNEFITSAVKYYVASGDYSKVMQIFTSYRGKLSKDTFGYFVNLIEQAEPTENEVENIELIKLKTIAVPVLLISMRKYFEAQEMLRSIISNKKNSLNIHDKDIIASAYTALAQLDKYFCITTAEYNFVNHLGYAAKIRAKYGFEERITGIFSQPAIRSFACIVSDNARLDDFNKFQSSIDSLANYTEQYGSDKYHGYSDLTSCEIAFFENRLDDAERHAHNGLMKVHENTRYGVEMLLRQYMLRIALHRGDYALVKEVMSQIYVRFDDFDNSNKQLLYNLVIASFYIHVGATDMVESWVLSETDKQEAADLRVPMRELILNIRYCISCKKYSQALTILSNSYPRLPNERFLFSEIILYILTSIAQAYLGDLESCAASFKIAYKLSFNGHFEMPFVEMGKFITPVVASLKEYDGDFYKKPWLETIERKATIYAKNSSAISNAFKRENKIENNVPLSEREREVLTDMCRGLSRDEIAEHRSLSINTIKKIIQSLYNKLDVHSNMEAVRIAFERDLLN